MDILTYEFIAILMYGVVVLLFTMYLDWKKEQEEKKKAQ